MQSDVKYTKLSFVDASEAGNWTVMIGLLIQWLSAPLARCLFTQEHPGCHETLIPEAVL